MLTSRPLSLALVIVALVAGAFVWIRLGQSPRTVIDLIASFPAAEKRTTVPADQGGFALDAVTIAGVRRLSILAKPSSRIIWTVTVPADATLETAFGLREDSWGQPGGDGAQFRIGVSDGSGYVQLVAQYVNPGADPSDRKWQTVSLDLSRYAGARVQVIFNTDPGIPPGGNTAFDSAVWGEPRIVGGR